jgi:hypothetical protein
MKKICTCCGRNRKIGKFGKLSRTSDSKNYYCRDCMRDFRSGYSCTLKGSKATKKAIEKWKKRNKSKVKEYNKEYYQKNKEKILFSRKIIKPTLITEKFENNSNPNINKNREIYLIEINPKRKENGR